MCLLAKAYNRSVALVCSTVPEGAALLLARLALAGIFWRSGRSKVVAGSWLEISDATRYLFAEEYKAVPLPADLAAPLATAAEHLFPILLVQWGSQGLLPLLVVLSLLGAVVTWLFRIETKGADLAQIGQGAGEP